MTGSIKVVVGGQYGSEGKGHVVAQLAQRDGLAGKRATLVRVAGPNAGHTVYDWQGRKWAMRQIPAAAVTRTDAKVVIAAGSEIDPDVLRSEITALEDAGIPIRGRLYIDHQATVLTQNHKGIEQAMNMTENIGSTAKGIGAARSARVMRQAPIASEALGMATVDTARILRADLLDSVNVYIEGCQGYGLGLHAGYYPFCTSSDCRAVDFLAMAGLSPWMVPSTKLEVWVTLRTHPIRVAGNSGPMAHETTWEALNDMTDGYIKPEVTTVTKKVRRVGMWDPRLAEQAVIANGGGAGQSNIVVRVALTFIDYIDPTMAESTRIVTGLAREFIQKVEDETGVSVEMITTGPRTAIFKEDIR